MLTQRHATAAHADAFLFETDALGQHPAHDAARADGALRVDDAMPRHVDGALAHGAADRARTTGKSGEHRELTVGDDVTARDASEQTVHGVVEGHAFDAPACSS